MMTRYVIPALLLTLGCGSGGGDSGGAGGAGGGGSTASSDVGSTGTGSPSNPSECPVGPELNASCSSDGLTCVYAEAGGCTVVYTCEGEPGSLQFRATDSSCTQPTVDCEEAKEGDACALPGAQCEIIVDPTDCGAEYKSCSEDHTWSVQEDDGDCGGVGGSA